MISQREYNSIARALAAENKRWPRRLVEVSHGAWPEEVQQMPRRPRRVWRSRDFFVQEFPEDPFILDGEDIEAIRLTICRTVIQRDGRWADGITWDELQRLKAEAGYGERQAVEIYPPDRNLVDDANMRHLWILAGPLPFTL